MSSSLAMSWEEWSSHDGVGLHELVAAGEITARELVEQAAAATERVNPQLDAVLETFSDLLSDPDRDAPDPGGELYGVPILLKDIGSGLKGRKREAGSRLFKGHVASVTDPLVENFLRAGLIPIGRTATPELGLTIETSTNYLGEPRITRNPWNTARSPGGSSGGSAAAVAAGIVPMASATDGAGSIRIPAAFTGLVGLKPSRGRVPRPLGYSEYTSRVSTEGVLTRTVRDTAAALDHMCRMPLGGSFIRMGSAPSFYREDALRDPKPLTIALSTGSWGRSGDPDGEVAHRALFVAELLESLGHRIEPVEDKQICDWPSLWRAFAIQWIGSRSQLELLAAERGLAPAELRDLLTPIASRHLAGASAYDTFDIWEMMACNERVTRQVGSLMDNYDLLLTPTFTSRIPVADGPFSTLHDEDLETWFDRFCDGCRYTILGNETGFPAIALPAGVDAEGMPLGVQFYGAAGSESLLLKIAAQLERARPDWFSAVPRVHVSRPGGEVGPDAGGAPVGPARRVPLASPG